MLRVPTNSLLYWLQCPIADTKELIRTDTVRMTVLRSGGTQLSVT